MSAPTYSCNVPERRAKDHKHRLLVCSVLLSLGAAVLALVALDTFQVSALLFSAAVIGAGILSFGAAAFFWVWWDVHGDGR